MKTILTSFANKGDAEKAIFEMENSGVFHADISLIMYDDEHKHIMDWRRNKIAGNLSGVLVGTDIPESQIKHYEEEIKKGRILVSVHTNNATMASTAREILRVYSTFNAAY